MISFDTVTKTYVKATRPALDAVTLEVEAELDGLAAAADPALHEEIVRRFTGPDYGWMWPFEGWVRMRIAETHTAISRRPPMP